MPRPRTGTIQRHGDHWDARITLQDGSRPWICLPAGYSEARARDRAKSLAETARAEGATRPPRGRTAAAPAGETVAAWVERWTAAREERGLSSASGDLGRLRKWLFPQLGDKPITAVTRRDVEAFVEHLDSSVRAGEQSWKTAVNTWGLVSKLFDDACSAKTLSLRVLASNPAAEVRGPDRGIKKAKAYLYPSEFLPLVSSPNISIEWRRAVALATYLYVRASELRALTWDDVDLERGIIHVHRSLDREGSAKSTKTGTTRRFTIEPALMPLLRAMHAESGGRGRVIQLPDDRHLARALRGLMTTARLDRCELYAADATRKSMTWHDLRATGITWLAIRGDDPLKIMQRAGHAGFQTTQGYIREAEAVRAGFGDVFPPLPLSLWEGGVSSGNRPESAQVRGIMVEAPGIEPGSARHPVYLRSRA
ncbi:hypothetical protein predicted by Glimmer/Critica [Sorangium cellulosum So ce56]|uniref:Integrase n=1 Tax=Sorangium cellulosum (strain So ce56) TaxID=448385 RepID=A9GHB0_SORC5|nr:hypothetical protein predicted by Glimmer/Critica [Sorangium cellulosum So ce56]